MSEGNYEPLVIRVLDAVPVRRWPDVSPDTDCQVLQRDLGETDEEYENPPRSSEDPPADPAALR